MSIKNLELCFVVEVLCVKDGAVHIEYDMRHRVTWLMVRAAELHQWASDQSPLPGTGLETVLESTELCVLDTGHPKQCFLINFITKQFVLWLFVIVPSTLFSLLDITTICICLLKVHKMEDVSTVSVVGVHSWTDVITLTLRRP